MHRLEQTARHRPFVEAPASARRELRKRIRQFGLPQQRAGRPRVRRCRCERLRERRVEREAFARPRDRRRQQRRQRPARVPMRDQIERRRYARNRARERGGRGGVERQRRLFAAIDQDIQIVGCAMQQPEAAAGESAAGGIDDRQHRGRSDGGVEGRTAGREHVEAGARRQRLRCRAAMSGRQRIGCRQRRADREQDQGQPRHAQRSARAIGDHAAVPVSRWYFRSSCSCVSS
jgi:hypothetical protein